MRTNRIKARARKANRKFRTLSIQIKTTMAFLYGFTVLGGIIHGAGIA